MIKTDTQLKQDIEKELRWDPKINATLIDVNVDLGAVTLVGEVDSYAQKWAAEEATKRVGGVRTLAQELTVKILSEHQRTDADIEGAAQVALNWDAFTPSSVTAKVQDCVVTLKGQVNWNFERTAAARAVQNLVGVVAVKNSITLKPQVSPARVKEKIQAALQRQAMSDTNTIRIDTMGSKVILTGYASSWQCVDDAINASWAAPGVNEVVDQLKVHRP